MKTREEIIEKVAELINGFQREFEKSQTENDKFSNAIAYRVLTAIQHWILESRIDYDIPGSGNGNS